MKSATDDKKISIRSIIVGINIVLIGLIFLLGNTGIIDFGYLPYFWKLWPLILVGIGINIILSNEGVNYIGASMVTLILVLMMVGSMVSETGVKTRKILDIDGNTVEFSFERIGDFVSDEFSLFSSHGSVKQTFEGSVDLNELFDTVEIDMGSKADDIKIVFIPSLESQRIDYTIGIKSDDSLEQPIPATYYKAGRKLTVSAPNDLDKYFDISITLYINPETNIFNQNSVESITIEGAWSGDVKILNLGSGNFTAERLSSRVSIKTTSGNIRCKDISSGNLTSISGTIFINKVKQIDARSTSGDIHIGQFTTGSINSLSGDVYCATINNSAQINTISGSIEINYLTNRNDSLLKSVSGDVNVNSYFSNTGNITTTSTSGDITMGIINRLEEETSSIAVKISTISGDIDTKGIDLVNGRFTLGGIASSMVVRTISGDIEIITNTEQ